MCCSVIDMNGAHIPNSSIPVTSNQPETSLHTINFRDMRKQPYESSCRPPFNIIYLYIYNDTMMQYYRADDDDDSETVHCIKASVKKIVHATGCCYRESEKESKDTEITKISE
jgi:hypothetical protein